MIVVNSLIGILICIIIVLLILNYIRISNVKIPMEESKEHYVTSNNPRACKQPYNDYLYPPPPIYNPPPIPSQPKLTLYYTNWCGYSLRFLPIWEEFVSKTKTGIQTEKIDCEQQNEKCSNFDISGFPSVILHKPNGERVKFAGSRTVEGLENFVKECLAGK